MLRTWKGMKQGVLNTTVGKLSAGTRVLILADSNKKWKKRGDAISHGYITVKLRSGPSHKLREQGFPEGGVFDVEKEFVTPLRERSDLITIKD